MFKKDKGMDNDYLDMRIKTNGHIVLNALLPQHKILSQIEYYLKKYKLPLNINISRFSPDNEHISMEEQMDLELLNQQVLLFQTDKQIEQYIMTEKLLANDIEKKLTELCLGFGKIAQHRGKMEFSFLKGKHEIEEEPLVKEKLDSLEEKCMSTLTKIHEERKRLDLCVVCWVGKREKVLIPCMHMILCRDCPINAACPICKTEIKDSAIVYH